MIAVTVGTVLAIGALCYVLYPLFSAPISGVPGASRLQKPAAAAAERPDAREALDALREMEFDRETGKLSDHDYGVLRERYTNEELAAMRAEDVAGVDATGAAEAAGSPPVDDVEALISRFRGKGVACPSCGPRPESRAAYCSNCGLKLLPD